MNKETRLIAIGGFLAVCFFVLDLSMELGVAGGAPYIVIVLLGLMSRSNWYLIAAALICTGLTVLGYFFSPPGGELWKVLVNRIYAIFTIGVTATLVYYHRKDKDERLIQREIKLAIEEEKIKFEDLYENAPQMFASVEARSGNVIQCNKTLTEKLGLKKNKIVGFPVYDLYHPDCHSRYNEVFRSFQKTGKVENEELILKRKDGQKIDVIVNASSVRNQAGEPLYSRSVWTDISGLKKIERELKGKMLILDKVFESNVSSLVLLDREFNFIRVNEVYAKACGKQVSDFPGRNHFELFPSDAQLIFEEVVREKKPFQTFERPFTFPDKPDVVTYWDWTLTPILDDAGEVELLLFSLNDITQRVKSEISLKKINDELEKFTFTASHDLQEPLRKIITFGDRLIEKAEQVLNRESLDYIKRMQKAAFRMKDLIEDLLGYSRLNYQTFNFESCDLAKILEEVIDDMEIQIESSGAIIHISDLPRLEVDKVQIRQLFQNLISNSLKYKKPETICEIDIKGFCVGKGLWKITVKDNGVGFDLKYAGKIFKAFERLHSASNINGTGMGLFICEKIAQKHKGMIMVRSEPGMGAAFTISLPEKQSVEIQT